MIKRNTATPENDNTKGTADQIILGDGCIYSSDSRETGLNNNVLVVGGSGSGKTVSIAEPLLLQSYSRSIICTVTKRRIVNQYKKLLQSRGYAIWDLDLVHPAENSNVTYDPLHYIRNYSDITFLSHSIVKANPQKQQNSSADPYWDEAATSLMNALIGLVLATNKNATFGDVLELLDTLVFIDDDAGGIQTTLDRNFEQLAKQAPKSFAVSNWKSFCKLPIKTAGCVYGTLHATIDSVFTPELRTMFHLNRPIDFEQMARKKTALFITSSPVNPSLNCFISMLYAQLFKSLFEFGEEQPDGLLPIPVHLLADDFATGCPVPLFDHYISVFREKRLSVTLLIQSESQLSSLYGDRSATTIINNCDSYVFMGSNDLLTARNISFRANRPVEDVLHMKLGREILFRRGSRPKFVNRYNTYAHPAYRQFIAESAGDIHDSLAKGA